MPYLTAALRISYHAQLDPTLGLEAIGRDGVATPVKIGAVVVSSTSDLAGVFRIAEQKGQLLKDGGRWMGQQMRDGDLCRFGPCRWSRGPEVVEVMFGLACAGPCFSPWADGVSSNFGQRWGKKEGGRRS